MPTRAAAALLVMWPSSGSQAIAPATNWAPNPGTLSMIAARAASSGLARILAWIVASNLTRSSGDRLDDRPLGGRDNVRRPMLAELSDLDGQPDQQAARRYQLIEQFAIGIGRQRRRGRESLGEPGDHLGVDRIVLGQPSGRFGEVAHPLGIHDAHRNPRLAQRRPQLRS